MIPSPRVRDTEIFQKQKIARVFAIKVAWSVRCFLGYSVFFSYAIRVFLGANAMQEREQSISGEIWLTEKDI